MVLLSVAVLVALWKIVRLVWLSHFNLSLLLVNSGVLSDVEKKSCLIVLLYVPKKSRVTLSVQVPYTQPPAPNVLLLVSFISAIISSHSSKESDRRPPLPYPNLTLWIEYNRKLFVDVSAPPLLLSVQSKIAISMNKATNASQIFLTIGDNIHPISRYHLKYPRMYQTAAVFLSSKSFQDMALEIQQHQSLPCTKPWSPRYNQENLIFSEYIHFSNIINIL